MQIAWVNGEPNVILYILDRVDKCCKSEVIAGGTTCCARASEYDIWMQ